MRFVPFMDITGIQTLESVIAKLGKRGIQVVLCEANPRIQGKLRKAGVLGQASGARYAENLVEAVNAKPAD
jgi:SulP family sulfate permease